MNLLATYGLGSFDPTSREKLEEHREVRYRYLLELAEAYLGRGLSIWIEGNFPWRALRSMLFDIAERHEVSEVAVVQCFCSLPSVLAERFHARKLHPDLPDAKANDISAYHGSVSQFEPLLPEELGGFSDWELLSYDSCRKTLAQREQPSGLGSEIVHQMLACDFLSLA
jgi:hypothetical protein